MAAQFYVVHLFELPSGRALRVHLVLAPSIDQLAPRRAAFCHVWTRAQQSTPCSRSVGFNDGGAHLHLAPAVSTSPLEGSENSLMRGNGNEN